MELNEEEDMRCVLGLGFLTICWIAVAVTATAQQNTGTILGVVKDSSGAVVPGAGITILNEETSLTRTVTTGENGAFRAPALPVGHYTVRVELAGFRSQAQRGLILEVARSEEHTSELQSHHDLVCRLLLEKKKKTTITTATTIATKQHRTQQQYNRT